MTADISGTVAKEKERLDKWVATADIGSLVQHFPIRETEALELIARKLNFTDRAQYEKAVVRLLQEDAATLSFVKSLFGGLAEEVAAA